MPDETIEARFDTLAQQITQSAEALDELRVDMMHSTSIEASNSREIEKLKRHVAKLQQDTKAKPTLPNPFPTADG